MKKTVAAIKRVLGKIKSSPDLEVQLPDTANIIEDVGLDSLEMLQFMLEIEEEMAILIDFDTLEYEHLHSIVTLAEFLDSMPSRTDTEQE
jgi:acyl carrier protein